MILLMDNYDSFTYNLYQYFCEADVEVKVVRNDMITINEIEKMNPEAIVISPGPGLPKQAGNCLEVIQHVYKQIPILGICLGHQAITEAFGGSLRQAKEIKHGKTSLVTHNGKGIFNQLPNPLEVMRYHSYVSNELPDELEVVSTSMEDDEIMAIRHKEYPVFGVQFHPESIGTTTGKTMILNFLKEIRKESIQ
ncbi:aminodeoxychorismate/anthranilate synthase component II [Bacilli bacterium]|uniref:anthranilate synthase component II n=1 Tax=Oceanobacillus sp. FSL K6-0118 TaxID=2921418 RepID=UPI000620EA1F|nr:anthranilate synthase subunit II [Bacilli bacterium VT-13-104]PZD85110.1 aminodeoxychorismate/anthranilate synthase component II [Bacilli bacterium]PZD86691.1 aminodeoxychorismate/anthranilate synthase component II [Bacilli bacterium]PZD90067.1 aminodeoxychorismate/anthranilate synthase component II [Bacilli bacterium]RCO04875.1 aminodeoxychorismate/anthranilate synthase component II [Bacilli bacterium]